MGLRRPRVRGRAHGERMERATVDPVEFDRPRERYAALLAAQPLPHRPAGRRSRGALRLVAHVRRSAGLPPPFEIRSSRATRIDFSTFAGPQQAPPSMPTPPFDLAVACAHLKRRDRTLGQLIRSVGPCELEIASRQSPYQSLFRSIVYQQLNGTAAAAIYQRACKLFGSRRCPRPQEVADASLDRLRSAGLSRPRTCRSCARSCAPRPTTTTDSRRSFLV